MSNNLHQRNLPVPFFSQRDNKYEWTKIDDNGIKDENTRRSLAYMSCNITSLCMILNYFGITSDTPDNMMTKIFETWSPSTGENFFSSWRTSADGYNMLTDQKNFDEIVNHLLGII